MHPARCLILAGCLLIPAGSVVAQDAPPKNPAVMRGEVQDSRGAPLEGAEVELLGANRKALTPASGTYRLGDLRPGRYWVTVRRIGYEPLRVALTFDPGVEREIIFQLDSRPQRLADIDVTAEDRVWARRYQEFVWRSRSTFGRFLTRDDIERYNPVYLSDVVRSYLPGVPLRAFDRAPFFDVFADGWGDGGALGWTHAGYGSRSSCAPAVSLNGATPFSTWAINDFRPQDVEAIEVYRRGRDIPIEFQRMTPGTCGLVVIWLR